MQMGNIACSYIRLDRLKKSYIHSLSIHERKDFLKLP